MSNQTLPTPYAKEKLSAATHELVIGRGRVKDRLLRACSEGIFRVPLGHLPPDLEAELKRIRAALTAVPARNSDDGPIVATLDAMSEDDAVNIARDIEALEYRAAIAGA
jgi:hypothetical protein